MENSAEKTLSKDDKTKKLAKEKIKEEKKYRHHVRFWKFIRIVAKHVLCKMYNFEYELAPELKSPYLVVSNHNTDLDPAFLGICFPQQMYFVASEHVYRSGILGTFLKWAFEPIAKIKGSSDAVTVMKMIRYLRSGKNVCLFPEGNRSFNGKTGEILEATGKLVKASNAGLVTYKFQGGYFATPRWGKGIRKGKITGKIVKIYSPEELKSMTPDKITQIIRDDLWEDAYETQKNQHIAFKGKSLALGFETGYSVCPKCETIDSISTTKHTIFCKNCGMETKIDEYGYFPEDFNFHTVSEWDDFQESYYKRLVENSKNQEESLFFDTDVELWNFTENHQETCLGSGTFSMFADKFVFETDSTIVTIALKDIPDMSIHGKKTLIFSATGNLHYEVKSKKMINVRKYLSCYTNLKK